MAAKITIDVIVEFNRLPMISVMIPEILDNETRITANDIVVDSIRSMMEPKTGKMWYVKTWQTGTYFLHQSSAPGESPASISGDLIDSSDVEILDDGHAATWDTPYASVLEFGKGRVAPRPFARPMATKNFPKFVNRVATKIRSI